MAAALRRTDLDAVKSYAPQGSVCSMGSAGTAAERGTSPISTSSSRSHLCYCKSLTAKAESRCMCLNSWIKQEQSEICTGQQSQVKKQNGEMGSSQNLAWDELLAGTWAGFVPSPSWPNSWSPHTPSFDRVLPLPNSCLPPFLAVSQLNVACSPCPPPSSLQTPSALKFRCFLWTAFGDTDWLKAVMHYKQHHK